MGTAVVIHVEQIRVEPPPLYGPWPIKLGARELMLAALAYEGATGDAPPVKGLMDRTVAEW